MSKESSVDYSERCLEVAEELLMRFSDLGGDLTSEDEWGMPFVGGDDNFGISLNSAGTDYLIVTPGDDPSALWRYEIHSGAYSVGVLAMSWDKWDKMEAGAGTRYGFSGPAVAELDQLLVDLGFGV